MWLHPYFLLAGPGAASVPVPIVSGGRPAAVIVIPDQPLSVVRFAAEELVFHLEKASGARLPVASEAAAPADGRRRIYLGDCRAARAAGVDPSRLSAEAFTLRTDGQSLSIVGNDGGGDPLDPDTRAGTLFGVYEWVERDLGARWLWPGDTGTFVPRRRDVTAAPVDVTLAPRFFQRRLRPGLGFGGELRHPELGFTPPAAAEYARNQTLFLRRHRMGRSVRMSYGHAFTDWWEKYGQEHTDWFQLLPDGRRGPHKKGARYSMCVSNPGLHQQIVALWKQAGGEKPAAGVRFVNAVENDVPGTCACARCKAWDGPPPPDYLAYHGPASKLAGAPFVSDRYARFWLAVQQLAARENPEAVVIGYAYMNYFQAPTSGVKLNPNVLVGFCPPGGFFPRSSEEHAWLKRQWEGWRETGARLFARTNHFLDGYCLPWIFVRQFADEFQHFARHGMAATDFDSLTGQWSTQGPNLYVLARLHVRPDAPVEALLEEYYEAFGAAAPHVKAYFDYWEKHAVQSRERVARAFEEMAVSRWRTFAKGAHLAFPPECFAPAEALLDRAAEAVAGDPEAAARVAFLAAGLRHAKLCVRAAEALTLAREGNLPPEANQVLAELIAFRRAHERDGIANFNHSAWVEEASWRLSAAAGQPPGGNP